MITSETYTDAHLAVIDDFFMEFEDYQGELEDALKELSSDEIEGDPSEAVKRLKEVRHVLRLMEREATDAIRGVWKETN